MKNFKGLKAVGSDNNSKYNELATKLDSLLSFVSSLENKSNYNHWNIVGDRFLCLHDFFNNEKSRLTGWKDEIAESIRGLGFYVPELKCDSGFSNEAKDVYSKITEYLQGIDVLFNTSVEINDLAGKLKRIDICDLCGTIARELSKSKYQLESIQKSNTDTIISPVTASSKVMAGFDKEKYKEIIKESDFFRLLRTECNIKNKFFTSINRGLRLAVRIVRETYPEASLRFFAKKKQGGYCRVELENRVFILGYTIYESGKVRVWTRELKRIVPVNFFKFSELELTAKPKNSKLPKGLLPAWLVI